MKLYIVSVQNTVENLILPFFAFNWRKKNLNIGRLLSKLHVMEVLRQKIIARIEAGDKVSDISRNFSVEWKTVYNVKKLHEETGSFAKRHVIDRLSCACLNPRDDFLTHFLFVDNRRDGIFILLFSNFREMMSWEILFFILDAWATIPHHQAKPIFLLRCFLI